MRAGSLESELGSDQNWGVGDESTRFTNTELHKTHYRRLRYHLQDISLYARVGTLNLISLLLLPYFWDNSQFSLFFSSVPVLIVQSLTVVPF